MEYWGGGGGKLLGGSNRVCAIVRGYLGSEMGRTGKKWAMGKNFGLARRALEGWGEEDQCTSPLEREGP